VILHRIARSARRDLQEISDYWTEAAGTAVALRVIGDIMETIITMAPHPLAGVPAAQFGAGVRKFLAGRHIVYYRRYARGIEVLHVFHGARSQSNAWSLASRKRQREEP
jgi:toxin ParE1/3/4